MRELFVAKIVIFAIRLILNKHNINEIEENIFG